MLWAIWPQAARPPALAARLQREVGVESPCIWMSAGLVRYRLCDRDLDCDHCPLDAALRGRPAQPEEDVRAAGPGPALAFPSGRLYTSGHLWLQARAGGSTAVGLDALAAGLAGVPRGLAWAAAAGPLRAGDPVVSLELPGGDLPLASPAGGELLRPNQALRQGPQAVHADCYGEGWIFEVQAPTAGGVPLVDAAAARRNALLDLRHFRRRAALALLKGTEALGPTLADGGQALLDLRQMLGAAGYLELVRAIVH